MDKNYVVCPKCLETRKRFLNNLDYCQVCYRKLLEEYSYYDYKTEKKRLKGNSLKICQMLIEEGKTIDEIQEELGLNRSYILQVVAKHTYRVNRNGNVRPF